MQPPVPISRQDFDAELRRRGFREIREDDANDVSTKHWFKQCFTCGRFLQYEDDPTLYDEQALGLGMGTVEMRDCGHISTFGVITGEGRG